MNSSLVTADVATHLKMITVALLAVILVMWIAIGTRLPPAPGSISSARLGFSSAPRLSTSAPLAARPSTIAYGDLAARL